MTTPTNGVMILRSKDNKREYTYNVYVADAVGTKCPLSTFAVASATVGDTFTNAPEDCYLADLSFTTGPTVMTNFQIMRNDSVAGIVPFANTVNTIQNRSIQHVKFGANQKIALVQA